MSRLDHTYRSFAPTRVVAERGGAAGILWLLELRKQRLPFCKRGVYPQKCCWSNLLQLLPWSKCEFLRRLHGYERSIFQPSLEICPEALIVPAWNSVIFYLMYSHSPSWLCTRKSSESGTILETDSEEVLLKELLPINILSIKKYMHVTAAG